MYRLASGKPKFRKKMTDVIGNLAVCLWPGMHTGFRGRTESYGSFGDLHSAPFHRRSIEYSRLCLIKLHVFLAGLRDV